MRTVSQSSQHINDTSQIKLIEIRKIGLYLIGNKIAIIGRNMRVCG